jgi:hypothetical protein
MGYPGATEEGSLMNTTAFLAITGVAITALWCMVVYKDSGLGGFVATCMSIVWLLIAAGDTE